MELNIYITNNMNTTTDNLIQDTVVPIELWDTEYGKYNTYQLNLSKEPTIQDFLDKENLRDYLIKVGKIENCESTKCHYKFFIDEQYKDHNHWVYILVIDSRIVKIGQTTKSLQHRWSSYSAGTKENRDRGTCSTTNYFVSELIRKSIEKNLSIDVWAYPIENICVKVNVFGNDVYAKSINLSYFESNLINRFKKLYDKKPVIGKNGEMK